MINVQDDIKKAQKDLDHVWTPTLDGNGYWTDGAPTEAAQIAAPIAAPTAAPAATPETDPTKMIINKNSIGAAGNTQASMSIFKMGM